MCLDMVTHQYKEPVRKIAFRIFRQYSDGMLESPVYSTAGPQFYPPDTARARMRQYASIRSPVWTNAGGQYLAGFHAFRALKHDIAYHQTFEISWQRLLVVAVVEIDAYYGGVDRNWPAYVGDNMRILTVFTPRKLKRLTEGWTVKGYSPNSATSPRRKPSKQEANKGTKSPRRMPRRKPSKKGSTSPRRMESTPKNNKTTTSN